MEAERQPKISRWSRSKQLLKSSWRVLKLDKELLTLPIIGIAIGSIVAVVGLVLSFLTLPQHKFDSQVQPVSWLSYAILALVLLALTFIANFIATAIAKGAIDRFKGHDPTVKTSLAAAKARAGSIFLFSVLAMTVGVVMSFIRDRIPLAGGILSFLGNLLWGVATFFVIPVIAMSDQPIGPIDATKQSAGIIKKVWGESFILSAGIGLIAVLSFVLYVPAAVTLVALAGLVAAPLSAVLGVLAILGLFGMILTFSVLSTIVRAAIYYWATTGKAPENFSKELLKASMTPKKARKVFA